MISDSGNSKISDKGNSLISLSLRDPVGKVGLKYRYHNYNNNRIPDAINYHAYINN